MTNANQNQNNVVARAFIPTNNEKDNYFFAGNVTEVEGYGYFFTPDDNGDESKIYGARGMKLDGYSDVVRIHGNGDYATINRTYRSICNGTCWILKISMGITKERLVNKHIPGNAYETLDQIAERIIYAVDNAYSVSMTLNK